VISLAHEIHVSVLENFSALQQNGFENALAAYNRLLYKKEEKIFFKQDEKFFSGIIKSVNEKRRIVAF